MHVLNKLLSEKWLNIKKIEIRSCVLVYERIKL